MFISSKFGNGSEEIAGRCHNNSLCQKNMFPGVIFQVSNGKALTG